MKTMRDAAPGDLMLVQHKMGEDEVREILYRREDGPTRHPNYVRVVRLLTVQGDPRQERHRYGGTPVQCRDPGEAHAATPILGPEASHWPALTIAAVKQEKQP